MKVRIQAYLAYMDHLLEENDSGLTYEELCEEHLRQISFFMHERLVHLMVTLTFALLGFLTFCVTCFTFSYGLIALLAAIMILLVPYIMHYYLLENSVQKMFKQYDALQTNIRPGVFSLNIKE